ncbi:hypothetical protein [Pseudomonas spirodelae]|uniref:hypothetical protein n=1 Tax=Pseudomonas spirodelae TaxID=3101751 RepID=UPI002AFF5623|nr:hypothetical protein [Pseudomonas sp. T5W1]
MTQSNTTPNASKGRRRALVASLTGSSIEWFDYFLYGTAAALVFNKLFFPISTQLLACCCPICRFP